MRNIIIILVFITISCQDAKDQVVWEISDFTHSRVTTLEPYDGKTYSTNYIKVKGYVNDTIKIIQGEPYFDINLTGKIDTIIRMDYYGQTNKSFTFEPFRATKGQPRIKI